jgi:membrane protein YqaA with SNARE-associated domain
MSVWRHLRRMGGPGLILLGIADNSVIPLTGSMDVLTIWLAARHREPWPYYALMATLGAVIGGYITYALARKGGKETMERKLSRKRTQKVIRAFERWGFAAVAIPALLPPPFPFCAVSVGRGRHAVLAKEISGRVNVWPRHSLLRSRPPWDSLWQAISWVSSLGITNPPWPS